LIGLYRTYFSDVLGGGGDFMLLAMAWMVMAAVMYLLRPSSMRGQGDAKPQGIAIFLFRTTVLVLPSVACWFLGANRYSSKLSVRILPYFKKVISVPRTLI
jgi:hypothetical protein